MFINDNFKMQEKNVASKTMYMLHIIAFTVSVLSFTIIFIIAFENGAFEATIALAIFNSILFVLFFYFIKKVVWVVIDGDLVYIGNIFFNIKMTNRDIVSYNSSILSPNFYSIKTESNRFYFVSYLNQNCIKDLLTPQTNG